MAGDWLNSTLGDVLTLQRGFDLPAQERQSGPYPIIASTGEVGTHTAAMVKAPGVVIGRSGSLGGGQYVTHDFWPLNTTLWVKDFKGNDKRFCYYLLKSIDFTKFNVGGAVPTLNRNHIHPLPVRVPSDIAEQRAIAHILGTLDDKIELNRRMNETLEAMARAIFKSWFVDFDPVRAKASGEPPESICRRLGLTPDLLALFPNRLVNSELGEIPEGWDVRGLDTLASLSTASVSPCKQPETLFEHYSIPAFDSGKMPAYDLGRTIKSNKYVVSRNAVLVSKLNPATPRVWLPTVEGKNAVCSTEFMQFVPVGDYGRYFLYMTMSSEPMQAEILKRVTGSTGSRQRAQPSQIATLPVMVPHEELVTQFESFVAPALGAVSANSEQSQTFAGIRDTLLPKLLSGELRIADAERSIERVESQTTNYTRSVS